MTDALTYLGVDGCRAGWFAAGAEEYGGYFLTIYESFQSLWQKHGDAGLILVDIPVGLKESGPEERRCDVEARAVLEHRKSSVFPAPCLQASQAESYQEANRLNKENRGRGLSLQSWHISRKIAEVDSLLYQQPETRKTIRESHPEIIFWALNDRQDMTHNKKTAAGYQERFELLAEFFPQSRELADRALDKFLRKELARDDILDALALLYNARQSPENIAAFPAVPEKDPRNIIMEIVYPQPE